MERNMMLTPDEYLALRRLIGETRESEGARVSSRGSSHSTPQSKPRPRKKDPKMARALRQANVRGRKKNGSLKKGWSQGRIMKTAHVIKRRM